MSSSSSSHKQERRGESSDGRAMKMKHNKTRAPNNRLLVDQEIVKMEQLEISTNMAATNSSFLPPEIVEEIIALLPEKSIHRFRFLSKSWFSLLAIKYEVPKLLCCRIKTGSTDPFTVCSNEQTLFNAVVLPGYGGSVKDTVYTVPELPADGIRSYVIVGSCNGLVCLRCLSKREIFVLNPFTGICRKLPHMPFFSEKWDRYPYVYAFGYDSASDDYKVFLAGDGAKVVIFSLKTGSWRKVENPDGEYLQHILSSGRRGLLLNGALHWGPGTSYCGENTKIIAAFDLEKEIFFRVPSPPIWISDRYGRVPILGVVGKYLCMREGKKIWVMKEYCSEASWVHFISYKSSRDDKEHHLTYVCNFLPRFFKDGRYILLQYGREEYHHVLKWNNNLEESDEAEEYSKKIEIYAYPSTTAIAYTETLTSPYASSGCLFK
ncbi:hypothetical protein Tsubulata_039684 [Turnera subulata]|uniref:F-box domain-containing protein n=1 Tax=Turnera subulata TaxID=218843 RepID=A0A9Q0JB91_9ROSI|nr:hypothetical protein Tsubulata_039684 [Turnera subulata]